MVSQEGTTAAAASAEDTIPTSSTSLSSSSSSSATTAAAAPPAPAATATTTTTDTPTVAIKAVVCDIEGTTTSISFVKDVLFVYALAQVEAFLDQTWDDEPTKAAVELMRTEAAVDVSTNTEGAVEIAAADSEKSIQITSLVNSVKWQMSIDRKATPLKTLQGLIWAKAYKEGTIKGHIYADVDKAFDTWIAAGAKVYIYSSGSVAAQKLLFGHSEAGDLLPKLSGHFDTKIGLKQDAGSYVAIVKEIGVVANEVLFLTDVVAEAKAAKTAELQVIILERPGNAPLTEADRSEFKVAGSFADISVEVAATNGGGGKRKLDDEEIAADPEVRPTKVAKVEDDTIPDAVDSTTSDVTMTEPESISLPETKPTEASGSVPEPSTIISEQPTAEAIASAVVTETEVLSPKNVILVPSEADDVLPMSEPETPTVEYIKSATIEEIKEIVVEEAKLDVEEESKATVVEEKPKAPIEVATAEESKKEDPVAMVEEPELTEQIKKTDSDAGDEPKIVDDDNVDSMDVDMADAASVVNRTASANVVEQIGTANMEETGVAQVELAVEATEEDVAVSTDETKEEEMQTVKVAEIPKEVEENKIEVEGVPNVDLIENKTSDKENQVDMNPVKQIEEVVDVAMEDEAVVEPVPTEKTEMEDDAQLKHSESVTAVKMDEEMNGVETPITVEAQTDPSPDLKITNGNTDTTTAEVTIPVIVEQTEASSTVTDSTTSPAVLSTSTTETNELTETTSSDSTTAQEKVSRVEITIEQVEKLPGQTTQTTTTHIVKEIIIKEQQHVSPTKSEETADVPTEQLNGGQTNGNTVEHTATKTNGKEMTTNDGEEDKNGDDSDKENEVSTTNGSGAAATVESEHLAEVVLKKCTTAATAGAAAADPNKPIETVPEVTA